MHDALTDDIAALPVDETTLLSACKTNFPSPIAPAQRHLSKQEKITFIAEKFRDIMEILGLDLSDESLQHTPSRVAKMYVEEIFSGLDPDTFPTVSLFEDRFQHDQQSNMIFVKVDFCSFCEHHFVPMNGTACVAYIPNGKLFGFSTIPKIIKHFAKRPQLQERLTAQIADALSILSGSDDIAVSLCAQHQCMIARGTESNNSHVITNVLRGSFSTNFPLREEFFKATTSH